MSFKIENILIIVENLPVPDDHRVSLKVKTLREAGYKVSIISIWLKRENQPKKEKSVKNRTILLI